MKDRKPMNIKSFLIVYNLAQVIFSTYMFYEVRLIKKLKPPKTNEASFHSS